MIMGTTLFFDVDMYDDGTMDRCVSIKNNLTGRSTVMRYDAESLDGMAYDDICNKGFEDFMADFDEFLQCHSNY